MDTIEASCVFNAYSIDVNKNIEMLQKSMPDVSTENMKHCQSNLKH